MYNTTVSKISLQQNEVKRNPDVELFPGVDLLPIKKYYILRRTKIFSRKKQTNRDYIKERKEKKEDPVDINSLKI